MSSRITLGFLLGIAGVAACSSHPRSAVTGQSSSGGGGAGGQATATAATGGGAGTGGAGTSDPLDGTPTRVACTGNFGTGVSAIHGRLDGTIVSIIPPGGGQACNGDSSHVHLQVLMKGGVYDVAVNTDTLYAQLDVPMPDGPWAEGWHPGENLDYPGTLGVHSTSFTVTNPTALAQMIESELAQANHVSVFATGYGPTGAHDVHRVGNNEDGAIVTHPLDAKPHLLLFCFNTDSF